jgi:uncharacterized OB-fold protein
MTRPLPSFPEPDTEPYWRATREHRLLYRPSGDRPHDGRSEWLESAGLGTVYTFTVIRQHGHPYFRSRTPYVVGYIDLDEGFRLLAEIAEDPAGVQVGQRVRVDWEDHDEVSVPLFRDAART